MMVVSCEHNNDRYIRQSYYIDNNSYVYLCPILNTGDKAEIVVKIGNKEGKCEISWGESPYYFLKYHLIFMMFMKTRLLSCMK